MAKKPTGDYSNFSHTLDEINMLMADSETISEDDWDNLEEEQQADFVRDIIGVRNILKATLNRYFDW